MEVARAHVYTNELNLKMAGELLIEEVEKYIIVHATSHQPYRDAKKKQLV